MFDRAFYLSCKIDNRELIQRIDQLISAKGVFKEESEIMVILDGYNTWNVIVQGAQCAIKRVIIPRVIKKIVTLLIENFQLLDVMLSLEYLSVAPYVVDLNIDPKQGLRYYSEKLK